MEDNDEFTINDLASKWRSKTEPYNLLRRDGQLYLPPLQDATQKFLGSLLLGHKKRLNGSEVKVVKIPQYEELRVKNILRFAENLVDIDSYTPKYDYPKELNREWLCNVINSLIPVYFKAYIDLKIEFRKRKVIQNQNLMITAKREFIDIFKASKSVSLAKRKSCFLVRPPL